MQKAEHNQGRLSLPWLTAFSFTSEVERFLIQYIAMAYGFAEILLFLEGCKPQTINKMALTNLRK
jgi:hypothetical protein